MMCQGDATDCLTDGRKNAHLYFKSLADKQPEKPLYTEIAEQFRDIAKLIHKKIYGILSGYERGEAQTKILAQMQTAVICLTAGIGKALLKTRCGPKYGKTRLLYIIPAVHWPVL